MNGKSSRLQRQGPSADITPGGADDPHVNRLVRAEQVEVIYHQAAAAMFISVIVAALLVRILWDAAPHDVLLAWMGSIVLMAFARGAVVLLYRRSRPAGADVLRWERPFVVSLFFSAAVWGIGGLIIMPPDSVLHQSVVYFFLMGMTGGSAALYSAHVRGVAATVIMILVPSTVWLFFRGELIPVGLASGGCIYILSTIRSARLFSFFRFRSTQLAYELDKARAVAESLARTDGLTGLYNRRAFLELGGLVLAQADHDACPVSAVMIDLDHFKRLNDTRGHAAGDAALKQLALILRENTRKTDVCGRLGGEEFAVALPDAGTEVAASIAETLCEKIASTPFEFNDEPIQMTASFGVACGRLPLESLLREADLALYEAKEGGRNRVVTRTVQSA